MPKLRKENTRKPNERIFILCEGEKTEPFYFKEVINEVPLAPDLIAIILYDTKKNTAKGKRLIKHTCMQIFQFGQW